MIFVIFGREYTQTVTGTAIKEVACEACGARYAYRASRTASARAFAPFFLFESRAAQSALKRATAAAEKELAPACDPVPCPGCGLVQPAMVRAARRGRHTWMTDLACVLFVGFAVATLMVAGVLYVKGPSGLSDSLEIWAGYVTLGGLGLGLWAGRRAAAAGYDPNASDRTIRKHEGQRRAVDWVAAGDRLARDRDSGRHGN